ncbi:MAG: hybrid sensor histidine kinase/response regulator [Arcobacter sp.]|uniref:hybrid sensor histidine kinase/response regulator n=1 Tax=Arcobacter sp. TaxID=1872629 RepID=UPI002A764220|nr:hybrid sensor histidine kinase/response regulator [Arcobacter sp.]MDY3199703.1 hybrid sensor histidine kinase/response regulator [Arcobacter sp.]
MIDRKILKDITVLYAEDESIIQEGIIETLNLFDINVICVKDGQEGLSIFKSSNKKIDLILTDIKMPKLSGIGMIAEIRKIDKDIPIIITTAHQETSFLMESIELNVSAYVLKPIDIYKLEETLIKAIEAKVLKEELIEKNEKLKIEIERNEEKQRIIEVQSRFAAMGEMIGMIAHQWRQPLASIGTASFNLKYKLLSGKFDLETKEGRDEQSDFFTKKLDEIEFYVQNLTTTIDDFRNFFKTDKILTNTIIEKPIKNCLKIMQKELETNNVDIQLNLNSNKQINMHENEILHVIINLLKNAQDKFLEKEIVNARIEIETFDLEDGLQINIYDNGGVIQAENLDVIFEPYFSTKKEKNGTGIGLYMSKIIVEKNHKGKLSVSNIKEGVCFSIVLYSMI